MKQSMADLDETINQSKKVMELRRALCVKMALSEMPPSQICALLNVSPPYVSKWRMRYEAQGAAALHLAYRGSAGYLGATQRAEVLRWIAAQETLRVEEVRDHLQERHGVVFQSRQSLYDLMQAAGMSYHKSEKTNPRRDEAQVLEKREQIKKKWRAAKRK